MYKVCNIHKNILFSFLILNLENYICIINLQQNDTQVNNKTQKGENMTHNKLRTLRENMGRTQQEFAEELGVSLHYAKLRTDIPKTSPTTSFLLKSIALKNYIILNTTRFYKMLLISRIQNNNTQPQMM